MQERNANYEKRKAIEELFEPDPEQNFPNGANGNISFELNVDRQTRKSEFLKSGNLNSFTEQKYAQLYQAIPAALLLYRLICTFGPVKLNCEGNQGYKMVWYYSLKHKKTNTPIVFDEWKGSSGFHTTFHTFTDVPEELQKDICVLIDYLLSDECGHPYDGLVAGSVA
jgi:hypothetical protein